MRLLLSQENIYRMSTVIHITVHIYVNRNHTIVVHIPLKPNIHISHITWAYKNLHNRYAIYYYKAVTLALIQEVNINIAVLSPKQFISNQWFLDMI